MPDLALIGFVFFGLFSPGPNIILLTTSGARFGFAATVPHVLGVAFGVGITAGVTGLGLGALLAAAPALSLLLKLLACGWILLLAFRLWHAEPAKTNGKERPFTFVEAVLFQWVNPKVWAVAFSAAAYVADLSPIGQAQALAGTFATINLGVCLFWAFMGQLLTRILEEPRIWRGFMRIMAAALVVFSALVFV